MNKLNKILVVMVTLTMLMLVVTCISIGLKPDDDIDPDQFSKPYSIKVKNDHEAVLTYDKDTVILFLENAYALGDQEIAFIYLSKNLKK